MPRFASASTPISAGPNRLTFYVAWNVFFVLFRANCQSVSGASRVLTVGRVGERPAPESGFSRVVCWFGIDAAAIRDSISSALSAKTY
jgi:hypothetical protein